MKKTSMLLFMIMTTSTYVQASDIKIELSHKIWDVTCADGRKADVFFFPDRGVICTEYKGETECRSSEEWTEQDAAKWACQ